MEYKITHNEAENRFETKIKGATALVDYIQQGQRIDITHTFVPSELEGQGIAGALTKAILDYASENGLKVNPICPYTEVYIKRHPEYQHLVG